MKSSNPFAYAGKILRVDLSNGEIAHEAVQETQLREYLGGVGLGAYHLYQGVPLGVEWSDPENLFIIATGPVTGTPVGGSGSFVVVTKGAMTNGAASCQANGFLGAYLKFCGFDGIIIKGAASGLCYLYVKDGTAEIRDAAHLAGKDTWETERLIKEELGKEEREISVFSIGIAGENLVKFACLVGDKGHVAAHNGVGAVLGAKKVKAIAVARAKGRIPLYDRESVSALSKHLFELATKSDPGLHYKWGTLGDNKKAEKRMQLGYLPVKNYSTNIFPGGNKFSEEDIRAQSQFKFEWHPCWACRFRHCHLIRIVEGPFAGYSGEALDYEPAAGFGPLIGNFDWAGTVVLGNEADRLGIDANESAWVIAWLMECYEKGIVSKKHTCGLEMRWGNVGAARTLLHKIARREGFCNILAEGVKYAAQHIGGEAQDIAVYTNKGNTPRMHDHRCSWPMLLDTVTSDRGRDMDAPLVTGVFTSQEAVKALGLVRGRHSVSDSLVVCKFNIINASREDLSQLVNVSTGWDFSGDEIRRLGLRIVNLLRAFNMREGFTRDHDVPSARYSSSPADGPNQGKSIAPLWEEILDLYYESMGWDTKTGKPLPDTLRDLKLEYAVADLWPKGN